MWKKILLAMALLSALFLVGCSGKSGLSGAASFEGDGVIKIPLNDVSRTLQKFEYDANGVGVTYFVVFGSDGKVRTAFDACDVCGGYKGYRQQGNDIACKKCERVFSINGLGTKNKGYGCWPSYLSHKIEDGNIVIKTSELEAGAFRFK